MTIKTIINLFKSARLVGRETSKKTGKSSLFHFLDFLVSFIKYGCSENHYLNEDFYRLRSFDRKKVVTVRRKNQLSALFNDKGYTELLNNKVAFNKHFADYLGRDWLYAKEATKEEISLFIERHDKIIVKPLRLNKGRGIYVLERDGNVPDKVNDLLKTECLIEEYLKQNPIMSFDNDSVNTIRVNTVLDGQGNVHVVDAVFRCGVGKSIVDNYCAGGMAYPLNREYGFVESYGAHGSNIVFSGKHPGSNKMVIGFQIPNWDKVISLVSTAAKHIPQVRFVGWDVAMLQDGPVLIEGNVSPLIFENIGYRKMLYKEILSYK